MSYTPPEGLTQRQLENDLRKKKTEFENKVKTGQFIDNNISFAGFAERWCNDYGKTQLAPKTYSRYLALLKRINPIIGHIRLKSLQPNHLIDLYNRLGFEQNMRGATFLATKEFFERVAKKKLTRISISESCGLSVNTVYQAFRNKAVTMKSAKKISEAVGVPFNKAFKPATEFKTLSNKTIKHHHRLISAILNQAVYWQLIILNPANRVKPPKVPRTEAKYLEEDETLKMLALLENEPMQEKTMIKLIVLTGMRRGEICGLEWKDINFQNNMLSIVRSSQYLPGTGIYTKEPKTESSKRAIKLSNSAILMLY
jgi:integrase